ncbi:MAG: DUF4153 domain-containing protein [Pirellulales bacterium]
MSNAESSLPRYAASVAVAKPAVRDEPRGAGAAVQELGEQPPVRWREMLAVGLLVALCDVTIYRGEGFGGLALLTAVAPGLLLLGNPRRWLGASTWIVGGMLFLLAARMVWLGSALAAAAGFALLAGFSLALHGGRPYVLDVLVHALQTIGSGFQGLVRYLRSVARFGPQIPRILWLNLALPLGALVAFGALFVLANPDLMTSFTEAASRFFRALRDWIEGFAENLWEVAFWLLVAWIAAGLLRPLLGRSLLAAWWPESHIEDGNEGESKESPFYTALRNTLVAVIVLFAVYLVFEFRTLWFRDFPEGFYYAGYAHEGAAWLTAALALATLVLSLIFRGQVLADPRLGSLRKLAWIWSAENLVLALTVYNRMYIYVDFNGMTRMRTIGLFGISAVLLGFCLVLWKILYNRGFAWLIERQLWTLAIAVYLFALTPVDALVHSYNVRRVLAGDLAPSVQISVHPINSEGILVLGRLLNCQDEIIREGVRAMLAERAIQGERLAGERAKLGWTSYQIADHLLLKRLRAAREDWKEYVDASKRAAAIERFDKYAYQWY